jgi:fluoride exporter
MDMLMNYFWVALGGALGSVARYGMSLAVGRLVSDAFPWGTHLVNVLGSFVNGWYGTLTLPSGPWPASGDMRLFVMVGICGGFTTFSSFSLQTFELLRGGEEVRALAYIVASGLLCLAGTVFGHHIAAGMTVRP